MCSIQVCQQLFKKFLFCLKENIERLINSVFKHRINSMFRINSNEIFLQNVDYLLMQIGGIAQWQSIRLQIERSPVQLRMPPDVFVENLLHRMKVSYLFLR